MSQVNGLDTSDTDDGDDSSTTAGIPAQAPPTSSTLDTSNLDDGDGAPISIQSAGSTTAPAPSASPQPTPLNPAVSSYLQSKLDQQNQQQALADAQKQAGLNTLLANLARAGGTLSRGSGQVTAADDAAYNALDQSAQAPVNQVLTQQKAQSQALANQSALMTNQNQEAMNDPNSPQSKIVKQMAQALLPTTFTPEQLGVMTAANAELLYKPAEMKAKLDEQLQANQLRVDAKTSALSTQKSAAQDKSYTALRKDLESFRGNQSAQQAAVAVQNIDKALALTQSQPTSQNLSLLSDEMGKIATGGVPGEHGTQALLPNNLATKIAELKSFVLSKPSSADVSAYMTNNKEYLNQVKDIAGQTLNSYRTNIAKGYKNRVNPDDYQEAVADYNLGSTTSNPSSNSPSNANRLSQRVGTAQTPTNYSPDVLAYAQAHNITPDAAQKLKSSRGGQ